MPIEKLIQNALNVQKKAYAPYSKFYVGAAVLGENDKIYCGCNIENASYGLTICAERNAIFQMATNQIYRIKAIAIVGSCNQPCAPCGACRQVIREFANPDVSILLCNQQGKLLITTTLEELLPRSFGPDFLE